MADLNHRCHGNFPQRRAALNPRGEGGLAQLTLETVSPETGPDLAVEEGALSTDQLRGFGACEMEEPTSTGKSTDLSPASREWERPPEKGVKALLRTIRIHPEAQRILGKSSIAVVTLERLNFQSVSLSSLQPVVSLQRLPGQTHAQPHSEETTDCPEQLIEQNGFTQEEAGMFEISETSAESDELSQAETAPTSWTEPVCPDSASSEEPEQDSGFDCDSNPDLPFILFDSGSDGGNSDSETFYLDPDAKQAVVIELGPQTEVAQDRRLELEDEAEAACEADGVQVEHSEDQRSDLCCAFELQLEAGGGAVEMESEDFCAVCLNGGELLCCDRCPKVFHVSCHIPPLISFPLGDWVCTLCRTDQEPTEAYDCESIHSSAKVHAPYTLSEQNQRRCEKLCLLLYCHELSAPFHEPVSPLAQNYYQIIKRPIDLSVIRRKLDKSNTLHYFTPEQFVDDVLLMFKNCATFNYPDSEVAQAGRNLEEFFLIKLKEVFPEQTFPSATQDRTDRARLHWLSRKRKENCRRKRHVFSGKKYCL
uniref:Tripartite motif containing 66 n=1 Tax=Oryzias latipes TaxID=8090 RepID=A0A3P9LQD1_ORYLA